jgi:predicted DNA-binding transcriptional regulator AlpA
MTPENPFDTRAYGDLVFLTGPERNFFIGRLSPSQRKKWLQDHPERWQTREDALRDLQAYSRLVVEAEPPEARSTTSGNEVRTGGEADGPLPGPGEDKPQPDKAAASTMPLTTANAEATVAAGDEIIIGERRFISERRVAAMLGYSQRQLQRWRKERKGPESTKIGRRLFYELNTLQEWIEEKKR